MTTLLDPLNFKLELEMRLETACQDLNIVSHWRVPIGTGTGAGRCEPEGVGTARGSRSYRP